MTDQAPVIVNEMEDLDCDICGQPLKGYHGYMSGLTRPVAGREDVHEYFKAIHISCYAGKPN